MLVNRKASKTVRLPKNAKIIKAIIQAIQEKKGEKVISLDLRKIPEAVADFFIVCEAGSTTQVRAIADYLETDVKEKCGETPYMHEGRQNLQWVIIDYINVVVHIMLPETRRFYKLEEMWSDAVLEEHLG
jgi:ribosome-associated protein